MADERFQDPGHPGLDDEFLKYAKKSGCRILLIGFEAEDEKTLKSINKSLNFKFVSHYKSIIKNIHKHGIAVCGGFMIGLENDTSEKIEKRKKFILKSKIDLFVVNYFTPFPGSKLFDELQNENRLLYTDFPNDWSKYDQWNLVFRHPSLTADKKKFLLFQKEMRKRRVLFLRFIRTWFNTRNLSCALYANFYNFNHFHSYYNKKILFLWFINKWFEWKLRKYYNNR